jgi:hypothetical protein
MLTSEHISQAKKLLSECEQDLAIAQSDHDMRRVEAGIQIAQTHALIGMCGRLEMVAEQVNELIP